MRINLFLDVPADLADVTRDFWSAATGWPAGGPWDGHPEFTSLEPEGGEAYTHVQVIDGPPRIHLDLMVPDRAAETERLSALGATVGAAHDGWQVMQSPGGLPFCLVETADAIEPPPAVTWPGGHRSRLLQVCIDSPVRWQDQERDFWTRVTGWRMEYSQSGEEFDGKLYPPPGAGGVRVLLQRLGADDVGEHTRAHLDLGTDDMDAEIERLVSLGAKRIGPGRGGWYVLEDPAGQVFCVTAQAPD